MIISVEDGTGMTADEYGNLGSALTSGISVRLSNNDGVITDLTDGLPVTTNAHWGRVCYDVDIKAWGVTPSDDLLVCRWTFAKSGQQVRLVGNQNERLEIPLYDNVTGLVHHCFMVQGYIENTGT